MTCLSAAALHSTNRYVKMAALYHTGLNTCFASTIKPQSCQQLFWPTQLWITQHSKPMELNVHTVHHHTKNLWEHSSFLMNLSVNTFTFITYNILCWLNMHRIVFSISNKIIFKCHVCFDTASIFINMSFFLTWNETQIKLCF